MKNPFTLVAPSIPVAEQDGLIKLETLANDFSCNFPVWEGAASNDMYQLLIDGTPIGEPKVLDTTAPDKELTLSIPVANLQKEASYSIGYLTIGMPANAHMASNTKIIRVDRTAPGATLLAPIIFAHINFGDALKGAIPGYTGMEPGDRVQTFCNGIEGPCPVVTTADLTDRPLQITFERHFLEHLDSEHILFNYQVTDRAGNQSIMAPSVELSIQR